jgi:hypothetical protein
VLREVTPLDWLEFNFRMRRISAGGCRTRSRDHFIRKYEVQVKKQVRLTFGATSDKLAGWSEVQASRNEPQLEYDKYLGFSHSAILHASSFIKRSGYLPS